MPTLFTFVPPILSLNECDCGKAPEVVSNHDLGQKGTSLKFQVKCTCGEHTAFYGNGAEPTQAWNRKHIGFPDIPF